MLPVTEEKKKKRLSLIGENYSKCSVEIFLDGSVCMVDVLEKLPSTVLGCPSEVWRCCSTVFSLRAVGRIQDSLEVSWVSCQTPVLWVWTECLSVHPLRRTLSHTFSAESAGTEVAAVVILLILCRCCFSPVWGTSCLVPVLSSFSTFLFLTLFFLYISWVTFSTFNICISYTVHFCLHNIIFYRGHFCCSSSRYVYYFVCFRVSSCFMGAVFLFFFGMLFYVFGFVVFPFLDGPCFL